MFPHNSDNLPSVSHVRFSTTACIFSEQLFRFVTPENIAITDKAVRFTFVCLRIRQGWLRGGIAAVAYFSLDGNAAHGGPDPHDNTDYYSISQPFFIHEVG